MKRILILGGTGFVGRALCEQLASHPLWSGARLVVPSRRRERAKHLFPLPNVEVATAQIHDEAILARLLKEVDAVANLVAILHGTPAAFEHTHVTLCQRVASACLKAGVHRVVHVSALGVVDDPASAPSYYLRTKSAGERAIRAPGLNVSVLRPSVIFGEHDRFMNVFAHLQAVLPVMPLAGRHALFQPVWVEDVASAIVHCLDTPATSGHVYECAGPGRYSLGELVKLAGRWSGHPRPVLPLPMALGRVQAAVLACLPGEPLMSADNLNSMLMPNVATGELPGLAALGITPTALEAVAPGYLNPGQNWAARLDSWRSRT